MDQPPKATSRVHTVAPGSLSHPMDNEEQTEATEIHMTPEAASQNTDAGRVKPKSPSEASDLWSDGALSFEDSLRQSKRKLKVAQTNESKTSKRVDDIHAGVTKNEEMKQFEARDNLEIEDSGVGHKRAAGEVTILRSRTQSRLRCGGVWRCSDQCCARFIENNLRSSGQRKTG